MLIVLIVIVLLALASSFITAFVLIKKTIIRGGRSPEEAVEMSGSRWHEYAQTIIDSNKWLEDNYKHESLEIISKDGLKLKARLYDIKNADKMVICCHGYTSKGMFDFPALSKYYLTHGYKMLILDLRAHGDSEGKYIGFGNLDRHDVMQWIDYVVNRYADIKIVLHGISMGGATVCMLTGLNLPSNIKAVVSDCAFTSAFNVFKSVLKINYHLPAFPTLYIGNFINKIMAKYSLKGCNSKEEVSKTNLPMLFIHGDEDNFVPVFMVDEIYDACAAKKKEKLIIKGAGHAECYYMGMNEYKKALDNFLNENVI